MSLAQLCSAHTATIKRPVTTADAVGAVQRTYSDAGTLRCRAVPMSPSKAQAYGRDGTRQMWDVFFTTDPQVSILDRLAINGHLLEVVSSVLPDEGAVSSLRFWRVACEKVSQRQGL